MRTSIALCVGLLLVGWVAPLCAQQSAVAASGNGAAVVPPLVSFSGVLTDDHGKALTSVVGVTFALYKESQGGAPLWLETQNVYPDKTGHYTVLLGSTTSTGLPSDLFAAGEARWLGVQVQGQPEQPRILLASAPYALKAADAQTVGGLPASAFVLAAPPTGGSATTANPTATTSPAPAVTSNVTTTGGIINALPLWTTATNIQSSVLSQIGSGATAKIGLNTITPASTLDVNGSTTVRGLLNLPPAGTATASAGYNSQGLKLSASAFNSGTKAAVYQNFRWQAEPVGNDTASPSGTLNLLYSTGANKAAETGLSIANNGQITFATGQTFPGTGTITGVTAGTDLTGGGTGGNVTLNVDTTKVVTGVTAGPGLIGGGTGGTQTLALDTSKVPLLGAANNFTAAQTVSSGNLTVSDGAVFANSYQNLAGTPIAQFINLDLYAARLGRLASFTGDAGVNPGIELPNSSWFGYGFTVPANFTAGNPMTVQALWYSPQTGCPFTFAPYFLFLIVPGSAPISGSNAAGSLPSGVTI